MQDHETFDKYVEIMLFTERISGSQGDNMGVSSCSNDYDILDKMIRYPLLYRHEQIRYKRSPFKQTRYSDVQNKAASYPFIHGTPATELKFSVASYICHGYMQHAEMVQDWRSQARHITTVLL